MSAKESGALKRDNTMQATAKEGVEYLKAEGKTTLLKMQGLDDGEARTDDSQPKLSKATTMVETAKEGGAYVESQGGVDEDAKTRQQQEQIDKLKESDESPAKKPRLSKDTTIQATAAEAKELLGKEKLGDSRSQTKAINEKPSPPKRTGTMQATAKEGEEWRSRSEKDKAKEEETLKRAGTMESTAKAGNEWVNRDKKDDGDK